MLPGAQQSLLEITIRNRKQRYKTHRLVLATYIDTLDVLGDQGHMIEIQYKKAKRLCWLLPVPLKILSFSPQRIGVPQVLSLQAKVTPGRSAALFCSNDYWAWSSHWEVLPRWQSDLLYVNNNKKSRMKHLIDSLAEKDIISLHYVLSMKQNFNVLRY